jgi:hypothetical protein
MSILKDVLLYFGLIFSILPFLFKWACCFEKVLFLNKFHKLPYTHCISRDCSLLLRNLLALGPKGKISQMHLETLNIHENENIFVCSYLKMSNAAVERLNRDPRVSRPYGEFTYVYINYHALNLRSAYSPV